MIKKATQLYLASLGRRTLLQPFSSHGPVPEKLEKVTKQAVQFNVKDSEGQWQQIHGFEGESFFEAIIRMNVRGFDANGFCNGGDFTYRPHYRPHDPFSSGPSCGSCRIILKDNWYEKIHRETEGTTKEEEALLMHFPDIRQQVRLACCIPVESWMNGCTFEILPDPELSELTKVI